MYANAPAVDTGPVHGAVAAAAADDDDNEDEEAEEEVQLSIEESGGLSADPISPLCHLPLPPRFGDIIGAEEEE